VERKPPTFCPSSDRLRKDTGARVHRTKTLGFEFKRRAEGTLWAEASASYFNYFRVLGQTRPGCLVGSERGPLTVSH
jgi:hypothetical protein